jgi:EmrB/QacA subfamily drug resistance transporter
VRSGKSPVDCEPNKRRWILAATILASSMAFIDGTVVNVALPFLQKELNATAMGVQWVVESYALLLSALLLVGGSLGDRYGRRRVFVSGIIIFALASMACGVSVNISQLIMARAGQGVGAALLVPGSLAIISASFSEDQRGRAIGTWSGFSAITTAIGPVLGGWLVEHLSWRAVFFLNIPIATAVIVISIWRVPESRDQGETGALDWTGATLATFGLGGLVYGLIESSRLGFINLVVIFSLVAGVVLLTLFAFNESRARNPMMPLKLFKSRNFTGANLLTLFLYSALGGTFFFFALDLIQVQDYSATSAGAALLPFVIFMFALSSWSGGLIDRFGPRLPLTIGPLIAAIGFALFARPSAHASYWSGFFPATIILGLGMSISVAPLTTTVMGSVSSKQAGVASGINNAVSRTAGLIAIAVFGVVMQQTFGTRLQEKLKHLSVSDEARQEVFEQRVRLGGIEVPKSADPATRESLTQAIKESFHSGFRVLMFLSAGLAIVSSVIGWSIIGKSTNNLRAQPG